MLRAFTTLKYNYRRATRKAGIICFVFLVQGILYPQQSFDFWGRVQSVHNSNFRLNGLESNASNFYAGKDWEISSLFSSAGKNGIKTNLYSISLSKRLGDHYFYTRFTPGYAEEFVFNSGIQVILKEPVRVETQLQKKIQYSEELGFGYSYRINPSFSVGFSMRYFKQNFSEDIPSPVLTDTLNFISISNQSTNSNFWRGDLGFTYNITPSISLAVTSLNLIIAEENPASSDWENYSLKKRKGVTAGISGSFLKNSESFLGVESNGNFIVGLNYTFQLANSNITFGFQSFHDINQTPFFAGIMPSINYSTRLFSITFGGVKYFEDRNKERLVSELTASGIDNLLNSKFSTDRIFASVNLALSLTQEQLVKIDDVTINTEIYPALSEKYILEPIATAKVTNISDKLITIRPACLIPGLNREKFFSPYVVIEPGKVSTIPFYTIVDEPKFDIKKREIKQAVFSIEVDNEIEDEIKKPILVNDWNAWDGNVANLKFFVKRDLDYSANYAKDILTRNNTKIKNAMSELVIFEKVKLLFENIFTKMLYVADRRASVDVVQFPSETLNLKGGDCDDLSVCFSSILESIGIETAFVDYRNDEAIYHVNLLVNTSLSTDQLSLMTKNDKKVVIRKNEVGKDEIWIPLEMTSLKDFSTSWSVASQKFQTEAIEQLGLANGKVHIVDLK